MDKLRQYNLTRDNIEGYKERNRLLKEMLGTYGEGLVITPPIYANFGLKHVHVGKNVYINFNCTLVDDGDIYLGDKVMLGPNVIIATPNHPISPKLRRHGLQYNESVHIGNNVWIGAGAIILPGVSIGDNSIVGAGAVVTKSFGENLIIVGNPARVLREITEEDNKYYEGKIIPEDIIDKYLKE